MYISNDKEKIREFSDLRRLQLPTRLEISNFRSDVDTSTSTDSISQNLGNVNPSGKRHLFSLFAFVHRWRTQFTTPCSVFTICTEYPSAFPAKFLLPLIFQDRAGCVKCIKKTFRKLITNCMNRWQLLTKGLMVGLLPITVYPKPPELSTRPSARHMSTLSTGQGMACCCPKLKRKLIFSLFVLT